MRFIVGCKPGQAEPRSERIAIIGAGPAGLYAAGYLRCRGFNVTVFDRNPEPGGFLIFGVLEIHINKAKVREGIKELHELGVEFRQNITVCRDVSLEELINNYDAVLIATGTWESARLNIPGANLEGIYPAMEWIVDYHMWKYGYKSEKPPIGERVVVIGGGLTAVDAVHVSKWLGAKEVYMVYRRIRQYAPAGERGFREAEEAGAKIIELASPVEYIPDPSGKRVAAVKFERMKLVEQPGSKRPKPVGTGEYFTIEADLVLEAIGLKPTPPCNVEQLGIKLRPDGTIDVDEYKRTTREPVFAAGDVEHGASLIGIAMKGGLDAAKAIEKYLNREIGWRS
ncbi:FAD-dependent oxidoreductase [Hyperthermus butylicus]|uniref:NADPH glutamate synthase n=1 Tax=Hyperthermus butylicus (strain DSM 5456 / JCM 9403 / PLM1-5) TaxID=415426 RepID=A2BK46_HYPBU|nr:FAD-dependent oxidoreductase [Hyperthermus butylicus]ABM80357.1 NADPH glutamate synthase [Hyperthermus butylicus DSM 5456]